LSLPFSEISLYLNETKATGVTDYSKLNVTNDDKLLYGMNIIKDFKVIISSNNRFDFKLTFNKTSIRKIHRSLSI
jgi:hypothetical protein